MGTQGFAEKTIHAALRGLVVAATFALSHYLWGLVIEAPPSPEWLVAGIFYGIGTFGREAGE